MPKFILLLLLSGIHLLAAVEGSAQTEQAQRITREFKVDIEKIVLGLQKRGVTNLTNPTAIEDGLEQMFGEMGMVPPIPMELDVKNGILRVKAIPEHLAMIPLVVEVMDPKHMQVQLEVKHIEMSSGLSKQDEYKVFFEKLAPVDAVTWQERRLNAQNLSATNVTVEGLFRPNHVQVLSDAQHRALIRKLEQYDGVDVLSAPRGISTTNEIIYAGRVHDYAKATVSNPSYYNLGPSRMENETYGAGVLVDLESRVTMHPDGKSMTLDWIARITQILDFDRSVDRFLHPTQINAPVPKFHVRHVTGSAQMKDGETLVVGCGAVEQVTKGKAGESNSTNKLAINLTLTPKLLGLNGEPINK